jgi:hypothetical protein
VTATQTITWINWLYLESPHPLIRLASYGKLKRMITQIKASKLSLNDRRLLRGLFLQKI